MKMRAGVPIVVAFLALASLGAAGEGLASHDPISILSDADFVAENGVISGNGTIDAPYLIEGWTIDVGTGVGIRIQGTSAHVLVRNCRFVGDRRRGTGIVLGEGSPARVEECAFADLGAGVFVYRNPAVSVEANVFTSCRRGIEGSESNGIAVRENRVIDAREHGVFLWRCHGAAVETNLMSDCQNGIYLDSCHRALLSGNRIEESQRGIFLWDCFDCIVVGCELRGCDLGLALVHTSERNALFHNVFVDNVRAATCDEAENRWDDAYPSGGNFWGEEGAADVYSGPSQDQPGADGIVDEAHTIPFAGVDRYPLVAPPSADAAE